MHDSRQQAIREIQSKAHLKLVCSHLGRETKNVGGRLKTLCPFHDDHDPSLVIYESVDGDQYHCYVCGAHGNVFNYVKQVRAVDFNEALTWLADLVNVRIPATSARRGADLREYGLVRGLELFRQHLKEPQLKTWAKRRKMPLGTLQDAGVFCCAGVGLYKEAEQASAEELEAFEQAGLLTKKLSNDQKALRYVGMSGYFEAVGSDSVIFPINSPKGNLAGFAFHKLGDGGGPKYRFNRKFEKSATLYRLDHVWQNLNALPNQPKPSENPSFHLYLVEGFMDALRLESLGKNAAAILGSNMVRKQAELIAELVDATLIKGYTPYIHFFLDFDQAGQNGTEKSTLILLDTLFEGNRLFHLDIVSSPLSLSLDSKTDVDPDSFLQAVKQADIDEKIKPLLVSTIDFLTARVLEDHVSTLEWHWEELSGSGRSQVVSRIQRRLSESVRHAEKIFADDDLCMALTQKSTSSWIAPLKRALEPVQPSVIPKSLPSIKEPHPDIWLALKKAACSVQTRDFPYDQKSWQRLECGGPLTLAALVERFGNEPWQAPLQGIFTPKSGRYELRLKAIGSPEDLVLQQYLLIRLARATASPGLAKDTLPAVSSGRFGINTYGPDELVYRNDSGYNETVSFAYQFDEENLNDPSKPLFKPYNQCWIDFNQYLSRKLATLKKSGLEVLYPIRLDIKGYYDNLPKYAVANALKPTLKKSCLRCYQNSDSLLIPHIFDDTNFGTAEDIADKEAGRILNWIDAFCFNYEWRDPGSGELRRSASQDIGIPQGPDLSAYVANIALFPLDRAMQELVCSIQKRDRAKGIDWPTAVYARYVDDIVIYGATESDSRKLQETLIRQLDLLQLTLSDKIIPMEPMSISDLWEWTTANRGFGTDPSIGDEGLLKRHNLEDLLTTAQFNPLDRSQVLAILHDPVLRSVRQSPPKRLRDLLKAAAKTKADLKHGDRVKYASHMWRLFSYHVHDVEPPTWSKLCEELNAHNMVNPFAYGREAAPAHTPDSWFHERYETLLKIEGLEKFLSSRPYANPTVDGEEGTILARYLKNFIGFIENNQVDFWQKTLALDLTSEFENLLLLRLAKLLCCFRKIGDESSGTWLSDIIVGQLRKVGNQTNRDHSRDWLRYRFLLALWESYDFASLYRVDDTLAPWEYFHATIEALINSTKHSDDYSDPLNHLRDSILSLGTESALRVGLRLMLSDDQNAPLVINKNSVFIANCVLSALLNCLGNDVQKLQHCNPLMKIFISGLSTSRTPDDDIPIENWAIIMQPPTIVPQTFMALRRGAENEDQEIHQLLEFRLKLKSTNQEQPNENEDADFSWQISSYESSTDWEFLPAQNASCFQVERRYFNNQLQWRSYQKNAHSFENLKALAAVYRPFIECLEKDGGCNILNSGVWTKWGIFQSDADNGAGPRLQYAVIEQHHEEMELPAHFWGDRRYPSQLSISPYFHGYWRFSCALLDHFGLASYLPSSQNDDYSALSLIGTHESLSQWLNNSTMRLIGRLLTGRYHVLDETQRKQQRPHSVAKAFDILAMIGSEHGDELLRSVNIYITLASLHLRSCLRVRYQDTAVGGIESFRMIKYAEELFSYNQRLFDYFHEVSPIIAVSDDEHRPLNRASQAWIQSASQLKLIQQQIFNLEIDHNISEYEYAIAALQLKSLLCQMREVVLNVLGRHTPGLTRLTNQPEPSESLLLRVMERPLKNQVDDDGQWAQVVSWLKDNMEGVEHGVTPNPLDSITPFGWLYVLYSLVSEFADVPLEELKLATATLESFEGGNVATSWSRELAGLQNIVLSWQDHIDAGLVFSRSIQKATNLSIHWDADASEGSLRISIPGRASFTLEPWAVHFSKLRAENASPANPSSYRSDAREYPFYWTEVLQNGKTISLSLISRGLASLAGLTESINAQPSSDMESDGIRTQSVSNMEYAPEEPLDAADSISSEILAETAKDNGAPTTNNQENIPPRPIFAGREHDERQPFAEKWSAFRETQEKYWFQRQYRNSSHIRVAFFQWNVDDSYQWANVEKCDEKKKLQNDVDSSPNCRERRRRQLLARIHEVCKIFKVDALLLPEYSVRPETVTWLAGKDGTTGSLKGGPMIWAGTYRTHIAKPVGESISYDRYSSVLHLIDPSAQTPLVGHRLKKYPSIAANEIFAPTEERLMPLMPSPGSGMQLKAAHFVMELICSENFLLTSPLNEPFAVEAVYNLRKYFGKMVSYDAIRTMVRNDINQITNYFIGTNPEVKGFDPKFQPRRSILFVPAMSSRVEDFIALGLSNLLSMAVVTVLCNAAGTMGCGGSCLIGPSAMGFHKNANDEELPVTPYNGFSPGIFTGNQFGGPLGPKEEALVIVDIDPFNPALPKPRPTLWPPSVKLVAHLPIVEWYKPLLSSGAHCALTSQSRCKRALAWNLRPFSSVLDSIEKLSDLAGSKAQKEEALCQLSKLMAHSPWQQKKMEALLDLGERYPVAEPEPVLYDWIDCEINLSSL